MDPAPRPVGSPNPEFLREEVHAFQHPGDRDLDAWAILRMNGREEGARRQPGGGLVGIETVQPCEAGIRRQPVAGDVPGPASGAAGDLQGDLEALAGRAEEGAAGVQGAPRIPRLEFGRDVDKGGQGKGGGSILLREAGGVDPDPEACRVPATAGQVDDGLAARVDRLVQAHEGRGIGLGGGNEGEVATDDLVGAVPGEPGEGVVHEDDGPAREARIRDREGEPGA